MAEEPRTSGPSRAAWIETVPEAEAEGELARAYATIRGRTGALANLHRAQSLHPEALCSKDALYRSLMFGRGALSRPEREAIAVVVSAANGCRY